MLSSFSEVLLTDYRAGTGEADDGLFIPVNVFYWLCDGQTPDQRLARGPPYLGATVWLESEKTSE